LTGSGPLDGLAAIDERIPDYFGDYFIAIAGKDFP
jgi:hypothetical protein